MHISEEASNAAIAVPWAIVSAIGVAGTLGWGMSLTCDAFSGYSCLCQAINVALAFCMGNDMDTLRATSQPMAMIFVNSFGEKAMLAIWAFVILTQ